jgi:hypothetical protein
MAARIAISLASTVRSDTLSIYSVPAGSSAQTLPPPTLSDLGVTETQSNSGRSFLNIGRSPSSGFALDTDQEPVFDLIQGLAPIPHDVDPAR